MSKIKFFDASEVLNSLEKAYKNICKRKPVYSYDGPLLTTSKILACSPNIDERFTEDWVNYDLEYGRSKLSIALMSAFQLGIEQGMKMCTDDITLLQLDQTDWNEQDWDYFELKFKMLLWTQSPKHKAEYEARMKEFEKGKQELKISK